MLESKRKLFIHEMIPSVHFNSLQHFEFLFFPLFQTAKHSLVATIVQQLLGRWAATAEPTISATGTIPFPGSR